MWKWIIKKPNRLLGFYALAILAACTVGVLVAVKIEEKLCTARWEAPTRWTWLAKCQVKTKMGWVPEDRVRGF